METLHTANVDVACRIALYSSHAITAYFNQSQGHWQLKIIVTQSLSQTIFRHTGKKWSGEWPIPFLLPAVAKIVT